MNANERGIVLEARRNSAGNRKKAIIRGVVIHPSDCGCGESVSSKLRRARGERRGAGEELGE